MRVLGIIPARGGSKGVLRKNIKLLCGRPLLAYTVDAAVNSKGLTHTILSTEDPEIAEIGKALGVDVPFLRSPQLAEDTTPTFPVVMNAVETLEAMGERYDAICLLQPTNPLRRAEDIDACLEMLVETGADSVISILPVPDTYNPKWVYWRNTDGSMALSTGESEPVTRRQDLPPAFHREGSVYVTRTEVLSTRQSLYGENVQGYSISPEHSSNIDTQQDWNEVEARISKLSS